MNYVSGVRLAPLVFFPVEKNHLQLEVVKRDGMGFVPVG